MAEGPAPKMSAWGVFALVAATLAVMGFLFEMFTGSFSAGARNLFNSKSAIGWMVTGIFSIVIVGALVAAAIKAMKNL